DKIRMVTSVIDYVFRDLAINYLDRKDLCQVVEEDLRSDTVSGSEQDDLPLFESPEDTGEVPSVPSKALPSNPLPSKPSEPPHARRASRATRGTRVPTAASSCSCATGSV